MSRQSTHHHSLLNSIPQTHYHHHQPNLIPPIKPENDSDDDDLVFLCSVPKVPHTPENYDPECQCSTCQLATKLMAECTCEECIGTGQPDQSSENGPIVNAVSPTNAQPSSSSIQNNDASTSEHTNANDQHDNDHSRSSTPDYLPRFFDDEIGDSSSDDSEDDDPVDDGDDEDYKELDQESDSDRDNDKSEASYSKQVNSFGCPKCESSFKEKGKLLRHYRGVHQEWKPYYCRWPKCNFTSAVDHLVITHANRVHFKSQNRQIAKTYVAKRKEAPPKDSVLEQIVKFDNGIKFGFGQNRLSCPRCGRNLYTENLKKHIRSHANSGYSCAWPSCGFFYSRHTNAKKHLYSDHLRNEKTDLQLTKRYLVKVNTRIGKTEKVAQRQKQKTSNCPKCGRNFPNGGHFTRHLRIHTKKGFRCTWSECGFFYSSYKYARKHLLKYHFTDKLVNSTQINEHLIEVEPNLSKTDGFHDTIQNNDASTSEHTNANDLDDDHSRSSTPDYLPRLFDDESGDSSSDDSEDDDSVNDGAVEDYREIESESDDDDNNSDADYAFSKLSTSKSLKRSNSKRSNKQTETIHVDKRHKCRICNQNFSTISSLTRHDRVIHQKLKPFYCKWPKCNFVTGRQDGLIEHITLKHFNHRKDVNKANLYVGKSKLETKGIDRTLSLHESNDNEKDNSDCDKSSKESNTARQLIRLSQM